MDSDKMYLRAYKEYQQENFDKCLEILKSLPNNDIKRLDLEAQCFVMKGDYKKAYDIYQICKDSAHLDLRKLNLEILKACLEIDKPGVIDEFEAIDFRERLEIPSLTTSPVKKSRRKKKRTIRLPKQYDPVAGPDPERWLPRRDRKNAAKQKKRKPRPKGRVR